MLQLSYWRQIEMGKVFIKLQNEKSERERDIYEKKPKGLIFLFVLDMLVIVSEDVRNIYNIMNNEDFVAQLLNRSNECQNPFAHFMPNVQLKTLRGLH